MWQWLKDPDNRTVLAWLGSGLVVLAGGAWAVFTYLAPPESGGGPDKVPPDCVIDANQGNVVCGDVDSGRDTVIGGPQPIPDANGN